MSAPARGGRPPPPAPSARTARAPLPRPRSLRAPALGALALSACVAGLPPSVTHVQLLAGATADGAALVLEVREADGATVGRAFVLDPGAERMREVGPLSPEEAARTVRAAFEGSAAPAVAALAPAPIPGPPPLPSAPLERTGPRSGAEPHGDFIRPPAPIAAVPVPGPPLVLSVPGAPALHLRVERLRPVLGPGADVVLASDGLGSIEAEVARFPVPGPDGGIDALHVLPGGARVLASAWSDDRASRGRWRVRALRVIDVREAAALLHGLHGLADHAREDWAAAEGEFLRAVTLDPKNATAHYNLACARALAGKPEAALASLRRALELDPRRLTMYARTDKDFASLRERPDFRALVQWKE